MPHKAAIISHWRLEFASDLDIEMLAFVRTDDGLLTRMHDVVEREFDGWRVATFNPDRNPNQRSLLRLINPGDQDAEVAITGTDDTGAPSSDTIRVMLPAENARPVSAADLGSGIGKWQLLVESEQPVVVMNLLQSPTGHLTNLATAPYRGQTAARVLHQPPGKPAAPTVEG